MEVGHVYVHAEYGPLSNASFGEVANYLGGRVRETARGTFGPGIKVDYLLEEGSLLERARAWGTTLAFLMVTASTYHDFKISVGEMYEDAKTFSEIVIKDFRQFTNVKAEDVIYQRNIPRDVGRLHRIVENSDFIISALPNADFTPAKAQIVTDIAGLYFANPDDAGVGELLKVLPTRKLPKFPQTLDDIIAEDIKRRELLTCDRAAPYAPPDRARARTSRRRYTQIFRT